eukprot:scaffold300_cov258-Pinguiococcus_pyrenoidosus.AAC.13
MAAFAMSGSRATSSFCKRNSGGRASALRAELKSTIDRDKSSGFGTTAERLEPGRARSRGAGTVRAPGPYPGRSELGCLLALSRRSSLPFCPGGGGGGGGSAAELSWTVKAPAASYRMVARSSGRQTSRGVRAFGCILVAKLASSSTRSTRFDGLMSRCAMPSSCSAATPCKSCRKMLCSVVSAHRSASSSAPSQSSAVQAAERRPETAASSARIRNHSSEGVSRVAAVTPGDSGVGVAASSSYSRLLRDTPACSNTNQSS